MEVQEEAVVVDEVDDLRKKNLPKNTHVKLRELAETLSLEINSPEIVKCGKLLSVIYACHISHDPTPFQ